MYLFPAFLLSFCKFFIENSGIRIKYVDVNLDREEIYFIENIEQETCEFEVK